MLVILVEGTLKYYLEYDISYNGLCHLTVGALKIFAYRKQQQMRLRYQFSHPLLQLPYNRQAVTL